VRRAGFLALAALAITAGAARAQSDSLFADTLLNAAVRLATGGQSDSARALVRGRLAALSPTDAGYPAALYAAGLVAGSAESALTYFRRVSIEYTQSPWAAPALVRLAQYAYAGGDFATAVTSADRVLRDYPVTPARAGAAFWAGRAHLELNELSEACTRMQQAADEAGADVELGNQARFYLQRCTAAPPPPADTAGVAAAKGTQFSVQVGAVRSAAAANDLMRRLTQYGFQTRVVRDPDGLLKIRVGPYKTRAEAQRASSRLKTRLGGSPFVMEEPKP
jgi:tetratricopeptide (TPR) repeat protein